jgi:hypothetical protein
MSLITLATGKFPLQTEDGYWGLVMQLTEKEPPQLDETFSEPFRDFVRKW